MELSPRPGPNLIPVRDLGRPTSAPGAGLLPAIQLEQLPCDEIGQPLHSHPHFTD